MLQWYARGEGTSARQWRSCRSASPSCEESTSRMPWRFIIMTRVGSVERRPRSRAARRGSGRRPWPKTVVGAVCPSSRRYTAPCFCSEVSPRLRRPRRHLSAPFRSPSSTPRSRVKVDADLFAGSRPEVRAGEATVGRSPAHWGYARLAGLAGDAGFGRVCRRPPGGRRHRRRWRSHQPPGSDHGRVVGPRHRTVRSFEGWNKGGCVVNAVCARCWPGHMRNFPYL